jgi:uncharacterized membrane protein YphA (DoxX/SURF4 family)
MNDDNSTSKVADRPGTAVPDTIALIIAVAAPLVALGALAQLYEAQWLQLLGRGLFVALFLNSGIGHFVNRDAMVGYGRAVGAPAPDVMVPVTGAMLLLGGASVLLGIWMDLGLLVLIAFLAPTAYFAHGFWRADDPMQAATEQAQFMKNIALTGACMVMLFLVMAFGPAMHYVVGPVTLLDFN